MSIEGRISVDCLFHDKNGTASLKVVSLQSSNAYATGKVAIVTGTAGTNAVTISNYGDDFPYRDASGAIVNIGEISRVAFAWSGAYRICDFEAFESVTKVSLASDNGQVSVSRTDTSGSLGVFLNASQGNTGTYTIVFYGN